MKKIAIIGGGAAGMTAAVKLIEYGADVTVFEKTTAPGLSSGSPARAGAT